MLHWRVMLLAALAVLLLVGGVVILPDSYEGRVLYVLDEQHTIRALDVLGVALLVAGCGAAWGAGIVWQRWMREP